MRFEPTISAGERPQTYALDRVATGTSGVTSLVPISAFMGCTRKTLPFTAHQCCEHNMNVSFITTGDEWELGSTSYFRGARSSQYFSPKCYTNIFLQKFAWVAESKKYYNVLQIEIIWKEKIVTKFEVFFRNLPGRTKKIHTNSKRNTRCQGKYLNLRSPESGSKPAVPCTFK